MGCLVLFVILISIFSLIFLVDFAFVGLLMWIVSLIAGISLNIEIISVVSAIVFLAQLIFFRVKVNLYW